MTEQPQQEGRFRRFVRGVVRLVVRLVLLLLLFAAVGLAIYIGVPWLYRNYIQPLYDLQLRVERLESRVERLENSTARALREWNRALEDVREAQSALQATVQALQKETTALSRSQEEQAERLAELETQWERLEQAQQQLTATLEALNLRLDDLEAQWAGQWPMWRRIQSEAFATRILTHILRAQVLLSQGDYAGTRGEIEFMLERVAERLPSLPPEQAEDWDRVLQHLEDARAALPDNPVQAQNYLEAAWNLLLTLGPEVKPQAITVNPFEGFTFSEEGTPTPTPEAAGEGE